MVNGFMKTTGKDYGKKLCTCERCGEIFESDRAFGSFEVIVCPKCHSGDIRTGQKTLASLDEEIENMKDCERWKKET